MDRTRLTDGLVSYGNALPSRDEFLSLDDDARRASNMSTLTDAFREHDDVESTAPPPNSSSFGASSSSPKQPKVRGPPTAPLVRPQSASSMPSIASGEQQPDIRIAINEDDTSKQTRAPSTATALADDTKRHQSSSSKSSHRSHHHHHHHGGSSSHEELPAEDSGSATKKEKKDKRSRGSSMIGTQHQPQQHGSSARLTSGSGGGGSSASLGHSQSSDTRDAPTDDVRHWLRALEVRVEQQAIEQAKRHSEVIAALYALSRETQTIAANAVAAAAAAANSSPVHQQLANSLNSAQNPAMMMNGVMPSPSMAVVPSSNNLLDGQDPLASTTRVKRRTHGPVEASPSAAGASAPRGPPPNLPPLNAAQLASNSALGGQVHSSQGNPLSSVTNFGSFRMRRRVGPQQQHQASPEAGTDFSEIPHAGSAGNHHRASIVGIADASEEAPHNPLASRYGAGGAATTTTSAAASVAGASKSVEELPLGAGGRDAFSMSVASEQKMPPSSGGDESDDKQSDKSGFDSLHSNSRSGRKRQTRRKSPSRNGSTSRGTTSVSTTGSTSSGGSESESGPRSPRRRSSIAKPNSSGVAGKGDLGSPASGGKRKKRKRAEDDGNAVVTFWHRLFLKKSLSSDSWIVNLADIVFLLTTIATMVLIIASVHPKNEFTSGDDSHNVHPGAIAWYAFLFLFTLGWMYLRCAVMVQKSQWDVVDDVGDIWKEYRSFWFRFDLFFAIPFEFLFIGWFPAGFYYASTHHFLRYIRVLSLMNTSNPLMQRRFWFTFVTYCLSMFVLYDIFANIFWSMELDKGVQSFNDAVYWTVVTMSSVGYGDVVATTSNSRIFTCVTCISGSLLMASLTAIATAFVTQRDVLEEELDRKKKMMFSMLQYYQIPWQVQREVISLFPAVLDAQSESQFKSMIEQLPSFVAEKIESYLRAKILSTVPLFQGLEDPDVILRLSEKLEQRFVPPFQHIVTAGELGQEMFFLVRGIVEVIVPVSDEEDRVVATLRSGAFFGEIALIESTNRSATVQAMTGCELLVLAKIHFDSVLYHSPQLQERLAAEVAKRKKVNEEVAPEANFNFPPTPDGSVHEQSLTLVRPHIPVPAALQLALPSKSVKSAGDNRRASLGGVGGGGAGSAHMAAGGSGGAGVAGGHDDDDDGMARHGSVDTSLLSVTQNDGGGSDVSDNDQSFADMSVQALHGGLSDARRMSITQKMLEKKKAAVEARLHSARSRRNVKGGGDEPDSPQSPAFFSVGDLVDENTE